MQNYQEQFNFEEHSENKDTMDMDAEDNQSMKLMKNVDIEQ